MEHTARRLEGLLREAGAKLAAARDAHVRVSALEGLTSLYEQEPAPHSFREVRASLRADCRREAAELSRRHSRKKVERLLKRLSKELPQIRLQASGWAALAPGLSRTYRRGRRAYAEAVALGTPPSFHEWRKRVKDLMYQVEPLCPSWPEQLTAAHAELKKLGKWLGEDHDLFMLTEPSLVEGFSPPARDQATPLVSLAQAHQAELRSQALALGARFYEEKAAAFCDRLGCYWKRWRHEPKGVTKAL